MPVVSRAETTVSMSSYSRGPAVAASEYRAPALAAAAPAPAVAGTARSSTSEFHASQSGQRPSHFCDCAPHSWQLKMVFDFICVSRLQEDQEVRRSFRRKSDKMDLIS